MDVDAPTVFWVGLVLLVPIGLYIAFRHRQSLPYVARPVRGLLTFCRVGVLLVLLFVLGGPYLHLAESVTRKPIVAVALDESASMNLPAGTFEEDELHDLAKTAGLLDEPANSSEDQAKDKQAESKKTADKPAALTAEQRKTLNNLTRTSLCSACWNISRSSCSINCASVLMCTLPLRPPNLTCAAAHSRSRPTAR